MPPLGRAPHPERVASLPSPANPTVQALVEALLFVPRAGRSAGERRAVIDAARFVEQQVQSSPPHIGKCLKLAVVCADLAARLTWGRGLATVPLRVRAAWIGRLAYGDSELARQLLRPFRCNALVAYYDHPGLRPNAAKPQLHQRLGVVRVA